MQALLRRHPKLVCDSICNIEPMQLRVKQVCQAVVVLRAAHSSRCSIHDPLQLVGDRLWSMSICFLSQWQFCCQMNAHLWQVGPVQLNYSSDNLIDLCQIDFRFTEYAAGLLLLYEDYYYGATVALLLQDHLTNSHVTHCQTLYQYSLLLRTHMSIVQLYFLTTP